MWPILNNLAEKMDTIVSLTLSCQCYFNTLMKVCQPENERFRLHWDRGC